MLSRLLLSRPSWLKPGLACLVLYGANAFGFDKDQPLPESKVVQSPLDSVELAFEHHYVSHNFQTNSRFTTPGADLIAVEVDAMKRYINDRTIPNAQKKITLRRYGMGDDRVVDTLIAAKAAGITVQFITDLNQSLEKNWGDSEHHASDFENMKFKDSPIAKATQRLLTAGFKYNDPAAGIISQPVYNPKLVDRIPIMHHKDLLMETTAKDGTKKFVTLTGTANMTDNPRYNRIWKIADQQFGQHLADHMDLMTKAYAEGKETKEMPVFQPLDIHYKNGSSLEVAFTDGKYMPNDRGEATKRVAVAHPDLFDFHSILDSEFVITHGGDVDSSHEVLKAYPNAQLYVVADAKFIDPGEFGKSPAMAGVSTSPPNGRVVHGWSKDLRQRVSAWAYQRGVPGKPETDLDGAPTNRHVWHDKTELFKFLQKPSKDPLTIQVGEKTFHFDPVTAPAEMAELYSGSMNLSGNFANAELQFRVRTKADSFIVKDVEDSVKKVVANEKEFAIPLEDGILRVSLGNLAGRSDLDISLAEAQGFLKHVRDKDFKAAEADLQRFAKAPSSLTNRPPSAKIEENIQRFMDFLSWYDKLPTKFPTRFAPSEEKLLELAALSSHGDISPLNIRFTLGDILWEQDLAPDLLEQRLADAWKVLKISAPMPPPYDPSHPPDHGSDHGEPDRRTANNDEKPGDETPHVGACNALGTL